MPPHADYDVVLVMTTFRRVMVYLAILKELSRNLRIGLYAMETTGDDKEKTGRTDRLFVELCERFGARLVTQLPVRTRVAIIPQWSYTAEQVRELREGLQSQRNYVLVGLTMGNVNVDRVAGMRIDGLLVIDEDLYRFRLQYRPDEARFQEETRVPLVEVGLPFARYPVFEDLGIDYLLANPTPLSLPTLRNRIDYLRSVLALLSRLPAADRVVLKPHNAVETHDYIVRPLLLTLLNNGLMRPAWSLLERLSEGAVSRLGTRGRPAGLLRRILEHLLVATHYSRLLRRVVPLRSLTPYHHFSLEVFLPQVRRGVITGRSNTLWHALYSRLPVYNCADEATIDPAKDKMNYHTMQYLAVPFCGAEPRFDERLFARVRDEVRQRDLIAFLRQEVQSVRKAEAVAVVS